MNQIKVMKQALKALEYHTDQTRPIFKTEVAILALRQAIEQAEKADQEAGFELWWGEFMPAAFRNRAWEAWSMAHPPTAPVQKPFDGLTQLQVAYIKGLDDGANSAAHANTAPAQQPLTDEQIDEVWRNLPKLTGAGLVELRREYARDIEDAHGIKGEF